MDRVGEPPSPPISVEEYFELELHSPVRHELVGGRMHAIAGATKRHNLIVGNISARLRAAARGGPCRVYTEAVKLRLPDDVFYYPDVMVDCSGDESDAYVVEQPCTVVEVVSPSTETIDRREKLVAYRRFGPIRGFLLVDQDVRRVERHFRDGEGAWRLETVEGEGSVEVACPKAAVTLDEIYEGTGVD
jgi:Uma2 family endonuclease